MAQRAGIRRPARYVHEGRWPHARLQADAPASIHIVQEFAAALNDAMDRAQLSSRALGLKAGVAHTTIGRVLAGEVLCDIGTLAALEQALGQSLWPSPRAS